MQTRGTDIKLVVIGDSFIGKTTMLKKYIGKFDIGRQPFVTKEIERGGEKILLQIHDTMGKHYDSTPLDKSCHKRSGTPARYFDIISCYSIR